MTNRLIVLPNKDLWKGHTRKEREPAKATAEAMVPVAVNPLDKAMQEVIATAKGGALNCLWCGQQFGEIEMREHIAKNHKSVVEPLDRAQVALHQVARAEAALAAATEVSKGT